MGKYQAPEDIYGYTTLEYRKAQQKIGENCRNLISQLQQLEGILNEIHCSLEESIRVIAGLIEIRDPYTAGHQKRVAHLGKEIALEMGLPAETVELTKQAAFVHDIGKLYVPVEILNKVGKLTDTEFERIKLHPQIGYTILSKSKYISQVDQIVWQHHERINGSGYPHGLSGGQIRLESRILSVADVVDAMAVARPYRPALGVGSALSEIQNNSSILYDDDVVKGCLRFFHKKGFDPGENPLCAG